MSDFGLATFKASPIGRKIEPIITNPEVVIEMRVLAKYGYAPVLALDARLVHLKPEVGIRDVNSQIGRWAFELIGETLFEVAGRAKLNGQVFETGATFRFRPKEAFVIVRKDSRPGGLEYPVRSSRGYELVEPGLTKDERTQGDNATFVSTLAEAVDLLDKGYHIRMGRKGVRSSFIAPKSLTVSQAPA